MKIIVTFHTYFGAMNFERNMKKMGINVTMMPVPRALSASCGVCSVYEGELKPELMDECEADAAYGAESYEKLWQSEN